MYTKHNLIYSKCPKAGTRIKMSVLKHSFSVSKLSIINRTWSIHFLPSFFHIHKVLPPVFTNIPHAHKPSAWKYCANIKISGSKFASEKYIQTCESPCKQSLCWRNMFNRVSSTANHSSRPKKYQINCRASSSCQIHGWVWLSCQHEFVSVGV